MKRMLAALGAAVTAATIVASVSGAQPNREVPDGEWLGIITFTSVTTTGAAGDFIGGFTLDVQNGDVEGVFNWASPVETRAGVVEVQVAGVASGTADQPIFTLTDVLTDGNPVPDVTGGGTLELRRVSCERITGTGVPDLGGFVRVDPIDWFAIRSSAAADPDTFLADWWDFRERQRDFIASIDDLGNYDPVELLNLQVAAESLQRRLVRDPACPLGGHESLAADAVEAALTRTLAGVPVVCDARLDDAVVLALRAGVIGSGAEDPGAALLLAEVRATIETRIGDAESRGDDCALLTYLGLARQLGFVDLASAAEDAFGRLAGAS